MIINIPKEELQKNINLEPNWYGVIFKKWFTKKNEKNPAVQNFYAEFEFECDGRTMDTYLAKSDQLRGLQSIVQALRGSKIAVKDGIVQEDVPFEPEAFYGTKLKVKVDNEPFEGRLVSKIKDFIAYGENPGGAFGV